MRYPMMILMAVAMCAGGCRKSDEGRLADDDTLVRRGTPDSIGGTHRMPAGDSMAAMHHSPMHSGNMDADMATMNRMMVEQLGASDSAYDARFIQMMIPHHAGAVQMANDALEKATHPELTALARSIIQSQQSEIDTMRAWLIRWYPNGGMAGGEAMTGHMSEMNRMMVSGLGAKDSTYDDRFIAMMIPHHQGAVEMGRDALGKATHPELKEFARKIVADQEKEIARMTEWRKSWYGR